MNVYQESGQLKSDALSGSSVREGRPQERLASVPQILLVDDDPSSIQIMGRMLAGTGELRFATSGEDALRLARESQPDLILLDAEMPGMSGFDVLAAMHDEPDLADVPVIFVTSHSEAAFEVAGFERGAVDFMAKPVRSALLQARVKTQLRVRRLAEELRRVATIDVLTGVANRRGFDESLEQEWRRAERSGEPLALLMVDIDHFKRFNDRYGHPAGDACLRAVAQALVGSSLRPSDLVARYGGEEFVLLLPKTPRDGAQHVANRILDAVEMLEIEHAESLTARHVTVSIGVAFYDDKSEGWVPPSAEFRFGEDPRARCTPIDLVCSADTALYCAKSAGRAQACLLDLAHTGTMNVVRETVPSPSKQAAAECS